MKVKVNFKKPTVMLTADKYSSMLKEMEDMRHDLALYRGWHAEDQGKILDLITKRDQQAALIQELNDQIEASETARKDAEDALVIAKKNATLREMGWDMLHKQIDELKRKNRGLQAENLEAHALIAKLNDQIEASESAPDGENGLQEDCEAYITELKFQVNVLTRRLEESESKRDHNATLYETASRAATELADMLVRANEEAKSARSETEDIKLELMDREFRIDELEKQVEWLQDKIDEWAKIANDQKNTIINYEAVITDFQDQEVSYQNLLSENTELISKNMDLKKALSEASEKAADFCAEAQFEKERVDQLEEANKKLYAQVLAQSDAITCLQRKCAADKEDYDALKAMFDGFRIATQDFVDRIRY